MNIFIFTTIVAAFVPFKNLYCLSTSASDLEWTHVWIAHQSIFLMHNTRDSITESFMGCRFKKNNHQFYHRIIECQDSMCLRQWCFQAQSWWNPARTSKGRSPQRCLAFSKGKKEKGKGKMKRKCRKKNGKERVLENANENLPRTILERFSMKHFKIMRQISIWICPFQI